MSIGRWLKSPVTPEGYRWARVRAECRTCHIVVDAPALVPKAARPVAVVVHAESLHYIDLDADPTR